MNDCVTSFPCSIMGTQVKGLFLGVPAKETRDKKRLVPKREPSILCLGKEIKNGRSEFGENKDSSSEMSHHS